MAEISQSGWKRILRARLIFRTVFTGTPVRSFWRWLAQKLRIKRPTFRRLFMTNDGQYALQVMCKNNHVFSSEQLSEFEQGRRACMIELLKYVGMNEVKFINKIKEISNEE